MAEPRQKALPGRAGHLATHQMVRQYRRREIGHQHQGGAHQDLFRTARHAASPFRRVDQTSRELAATPTAGSLAISAGKCAGLTKGSRAEPLPIPKGAGDVPKMPRAWKRPGSSGGARGLPRACARLPGSDDHRTAIASISISQPGWANAVTPTSVDAGAFLPKNSSRIEAKSLRCRISTR